MLPFIVALAVSGQQVSIAPPPVPAGEVVVTGRRYMDEYERCISAQCPPELEVEAALLAAVEQFRQGRYSSARALLNRTIGRNKKYAARMPARISDLYSTYADVSLHEGLPRQYRSATYESVDVLRDHLGARHPSTLITRAAIGDVLVRQNRIRGANDLYRDVERDARVAGLGRIASYVLVRRAWLAPQLESDRLAGEMLDRILADNPGDDAFVSIVRAIRVRIAIRQNDDALTERLIAEWRTTPAVKPILLWQPDDPILSGANLSILNYGSAAGGGRDEFSWVDIGYWIRPNGSVDQVEILRPRRAAVWGKPLLTQISRRRYAPLAEANGSPGLYRIERVTARQDFEFITGTRIAQRFGPTKLIRVDITDPIGAEKTGVVP